MKMKLSISTMLLQDNVSPRYVITIALTIVQRGRGVATHSILPFITPAALQKNFLILLDNIPTGRYVSLDALEAGMHATAKPQRKNKILATPPWR